MKSNLVRSFGKVFETSLGKRLGKRLGKVFGKALRCHVLCLIVLCVAVGCAEEVSEPEYITSPYTEQTIAFFDRSRPDISKRHGSGPVEEKNMLVSVEKDGQRCLLKKQPKTNYINPKNYTLETVPEKFVEGIVFGCVTIASNGGGPFDPAVLEKILCAFGTIKADWLALSNLEFNDPSSDTGEHLRTLTSRCVLDVNMFGISHTPKTAIEWLQERVVLTGLRITLTIDCMADFGNLEVLDGFSGADIAMLLICYNSVDNLDSLDCKLFREGPLPDGLYIRGDKNTVVTPKISEQIIRNMLAKVWEKLTIPVELWVELMKPSEQPKHLTAKYLEITFCPGSTIPVPVVGMDRTTAWYFSIRLTNANKVVTRTDLEQTLDWVSVAFVDLKKLSVMGASEPEVKDFVRTHAIEITSIPTLEHVQVSGIRWIHIGDGSNILCLSLEAWELYTKGKLGDELTRTQTDLSVLLPEQQAMVMSKEEMAADDKPCTVCLCTVASLRSTNPDTQIYILEHLKHPTVCCGCLDVMVKACGDYKSLWDLFSPKEHRLP
ncbi:hypothetical protein NEDG_01771, partial [Nematocida displodere]